MCGVTVVSNGEEGVGVGIKEERTGAGAGEPMEGGWSGWKGVGVEGQSEEARGG